MRQSIAQERSVGFSSFASSTLNLGSSARPSVMSVTQATASQVVDESTGIRSDDLLASSHSSIDIDYDG
jgi:hypothetical protein